MFVFDQNKEYIRNVKRVRAAPHAECGQGLENPYIGQAWYAQCCKKNAVSCSSLKKSDFMSTEDGAIVLIRNIQCDTGRGIEKGELRIGPVRRNQKMRAYECEWGLSVWHPKTGSTFGVDPLQ